MRFGQRPGVFYVLVTAALSLLNTTTRATTTGDAACLFGNICVTGLLDGDTETYLLTSSNNVGWMAIGFGLGMVGSPMVITWPNSDGTFTISQRQGTDHIEPNYVPNPPRVAALSKDRSTAQGVNTTIAFTMPHESSSSSTVNMIYAISSFRPSTNDPTTTSLIQHDFMGLFTLNLGKSLTSPSQSANPANPSTTATLEPLPLPTPHTETSYPPLLSYQKKTIAHGVLAATGFLVFLPLGALLGRYRVLNPFWFKMHYFVQLALSGPIIITAFALGVNIVQGNHDEHFRTKHEMVGITLFLAYIVQALLGLVIHYVKPSQPRSRPPQNYLHAIFGLSIICTAFYNVRLGYKVQWPTIAGRGDAPRGVNIAWWIWVVLLPVLYCAGLVFLRRQYREEKVKKELYTMDSAERCRYGR